MLQHVHVLAAGPTLLRHQHCCCCCMASLQAHGFAFGKSDLFFCCGCRVVGSHTELRKCVSATKSRDQCVRHHSSHFAAAVVSISPSHEAQAASSSSCSCSCRVSSQALAHRGAHDSVAMAWTLTLLQPAPTAVAPVSAATCCPYCGCSCFCCNLLQSVCRSVRLLRCHGSHLMTTWLNRFSKTCHWPITP